MKLPIRDTLHLFATGEKKIPRNVGSRKTINEKAGYKCPPRGGYRPPLLPPDDNKRASLVALFMSGIVVGFGISVIYEHYYNKTFVPIEPCNIGQPPSKPKKTKKFRAPCPLPCPEVDKIEPLKCKPRCVENKEEKEEQDLEIVFIEEDPYVLDNGERSESLEIELIVEDPSDNEHK